MHRHNFEFSERVRASNRGKGEEKKKKRWQQGFACMDSVWLKFFFKKKFLKNKSFFKKKFNKQIFKYT